MHNCFKYLLRWTPPPFYYRSVDFDIDSNAMFCTIELWNSLFLADESSINNGNYVQKPFGCTECDFVNIRKDLYNKYLQLHLNDRPFSCIKCDFINEGKRDFERYYRIHTIVKGFVCQECGFTFTQKASRLVHKQIHMGEKLFACSKCEESFGSKDNFVKHVNSYKINVN